MQRRWDTGGVDQDSNELSLRASDFPSLLESSSPMLAVWRLEVSGIDTLDCADLVRLVPNVSCLSLAGDLGTLENASELQRLSRLRTLFIQNLFSMGPSDAVTVRELPALEMLGLYSIPYDYATAMRKAWKPEIANGTNVEIRSPRKAMWVEENRDNPLRDWDGREHINSARYRKAVAQYQMTRRAVIATLAAPDPTSVSSDLTQLGREFAKAFNGFDAGRNPFIETEEREELFGALDAAVAASEDRHGRQFPGAREALATGVNEVRDW